MQVPFGLMNRENRLLVANEPCEFEKQPVEVEDCKKITDHFYRNVENIVKLMEKY